MIFLFNTLDKKAQFHDCIYLLKSFEIGLTLLTTIVNAGDQLLNVEIVDDEGHRYELPIEAFDGHSFLIPFQQLEKQWRQILRKPVKLPTSHQWQIDLLQRRVKLQESKLAHYQQMAVNLEVGLLSAKEIGSTSIHKTALINRYKSLLSKNQESISRAEAEHKLVSDRLSQLVNE